jgi:methylglyoxal/glyoxal reductase
LVLLHAPAIPSGISKVEQNGELNKAQRESAWKALEKFYELGLTKSIGVSNFWPRHFEHLETFAKVKPMINQIEYHPWNQRPLQVEYCQKNGIVVEGWGPLAQNKLLEDETMKKLAEKYKKTVAQVSIRWHLQKGIIVIPKSIKESRVIENADVYDFEVSEEDIKLIDSLHKGYLCVGVWEHDEVL